MSIEEINECKNYTRLFHLYVIYLKYRFQYLEINYTFNIILTLNDKVRCDKNKKGGLHVKVKEDVKEIKDKQELQKFLKPLYIINDYMITDSDYKLFQENIYNLLKGCIEKKECRECPVKFKFYVKDKTTHTLQFRHFLVNVFLWYPFVNLYGIPDILNENFILNCFEDIPNITEYINDYIITVLRDYCVKNIVVNRSVSEVLYNLRRISIDFSLIMNLTLGSETFLQMFERNERIRQIMQTTFPIDMQPADIEHELTNLMNEEIEIFKGEKNNPVGVILRAGSGIKHKQLSEFTVNMGLKPDLSGVTIPLPINSNTMVNGINKPSAHYIDSLGARKSLVLNWACKITLIAGNSRLCLNY